jgi:hypothetical protein
MSYNSLRGYYETSRLLKKYCQYDLFEQESLIPFEREIILNMVMLEIQQEESKKFKDYSKIERYKIKNS